MIEKSEQYMRRCFQLALNGLGNVAPNPMVGAVIVYNNQIIGEGYHRQWGGPHAEVNAVASVKNPELLKDSTIYVSLEPCSHYGKTPPCAKLLIDKHIPRVVVANNDPFPQVSGRGFNMLREAGAEVETGFLADEGWEINRRFFTFHTKHRPYIILKWAQSVDCKMAASSPSQRLYISNSFTSALSHQLRSHESAIMVGTHTALADNPTLTVRDYAGKNPLRILVDRTLKVPFTSNIYNAEADTLVFTSLPQTSLPDKPNVTFIQSPFNTCGVDLYFVMEQLYLRQVQSLIVEGGAHLLNSMLEAGLVDECRVETAQNIVVGEGIEAPKPVGKIIQSDMFQDNLVQRFRVK